MYDHIFLVGSGLHVRLYSQQKNTKLGAEKQTANLRTWQHVIHRRADPDRFSDSVSAHSLAKKKPFGWQDDGFTRTRCGN